jgi:hypothetical protein|tara:strand:- start:1249 stop:1524 length:276 start_codon:yes stop_codon:yes gene_type:complete
MKPVKSNLSKNGCSPVASDCVTWNGPDLCCITECDGDTLSSVVFKLSQELCYHRALLDLTVLDLGDLVLSGDGTRTPANVLQAIINRIQNT